MCRPNCGQPRSVSGRSVIGPVYSGDARSVAPSWVPGSMRDTGQQVTADYRTGGVGGAIIRSASADTDVQHAPPSPRIPSAPAVYSQQCR